MNKASKDIVVGIIVTVVGGIILYFILDRWIKPTIEPDIKDEVVDTTEMPPPSDITTEIVPTPVAGTGNDIPNDEDETDKQVMVQVPEKRIVEVTLIVDAVFSDAAIYANGVQISPVTNTLTIKELEIEYTTSTIKLEVKASQKACEKLITVPHDYIYKSSNKITITCTQ